MSQERVAPLLGPRRHFALHFLHVLPFLLLQCFLLLCSTESGYPLLFSPAFSSLFILCLFHSLIPDKLLFELLVHIFAGAPKLRFSLRTETQSRKNVRELQNQLKRRFSIGGWSEGKDDVLFLLCGGQWTISGTISRLIGDLEWRISS